MLEAQGTKRLKIGRSRNPLERNQRINCQSPYPLKIVDSFWTPDSAADEKYIHEKLSKYRVYGEYFEFDRTLEDLDADIELYKIRKSKHDQIGYLEFLINFVSIDWYIGASHTLTFLHLYARQFLSDEYCKYGEMSCKEDWDISSIYKNAKSISELKKAHKFIYEILPKYMESQCPYTCDNKTRKLLIQSLIFGYIEKLCLDVTQG
jgi:hypothetical protein